MAWNSFTAFSLSYVGGAIFGAVFHLITIALSRSNDPFLNTKPTTNFKSFKEMMNTRYKNIKGIMHRNGLFVLRLTAFITIFNFLMVNVMNYLNSFQ